MPGVVDAALVLARTEQFVLAAGPLLAYPNGVDITLRLFLADDADYDPAMHAEIGGGGPWAPEPDHLLRWGVDYGDGRKAINLRGYGTWPHPGPVDLSEPPPEPVLMHRGGTGMGGDSLQTYWLHPLPEKGTLAFVVEWLHRGVPETRAELDADLLAKAARRSWSVWRP
jgi:hypothetical protein